MSSEALDALEEIRHSNGMLFAGLFKQHILDELYAAKLIRNRYVGMAGLLGMPYVEVNET